MDSGGECIVHQPNTDISGIGIRISFYMQAICLSLLSIRSSSAVESGNALSTLIVTNIAYAVATLLLGFRQPTISLYDALVVIYLLAFSWVAIFFSLPHYTRFKRSQLTLKILAIIQSYISFITAWVILGKAETFGNDLDCNQNVLAFIFSTFPLIPKGRIAFLVIAAVFAFVQTVLLWLDYKEKIPDKFSTREGQEEDTDGSNEKSEGVAVPPPSSVATRSDNRSRENRKRKRHKKSFDGTIAFNLMVILIAAALGIFNTEKLRQSNHPTKDDTNWTFGQILPVFLTILPLWSTLRAFGMHGLGEKKRKRTRKRKHNRSRSTTNGSAHNEV